MSYILLPPWGLMDDLLMSDMEDPIPPDWKPPGGGPPNAQNWEKWLQEIIDAIDILLWPRYQPGGATWDTPQIAKLFEVDFALLASLQAFFSSPVKAAQPTTLRHFHFFAEEDNERIGFGASYERYDPYLPQGALERFPLEVRKGFLNKVATLDLQLKNVFQRPRAYQVAFIQRRSFSHQLAVTANTPSLVSGHCLEASLGGCNAFAQLSDLMGRASIEVLQQFTVDIGDRRVFAGVHYPSDNLSSWYTALKLIPRVFDPEVAPSVKKFLWDAISSKSTVYAAVSKHAADSDSPYKSMVDTLKALGEDT